jgi:hypothetical protein
MMDIQQRSSNPAEIEDPTSEPIAQARLATFGDSWPHDGKKGWMCQSDKVKQLFCNPKACMSNGIFLDGRWLKADGTFVPTKKAPTSRAAPTANCP